jgi:hypothetical protein
VEENEWQDQNENENEEENEYENEWEVYPIPWFVSPQTNIFERI